MKEQEINEASLTTKQGFANNAPVPQMDENGNAGGVMTYSDASGGDLATHEADVTLHKTAAEQSKLDHLADDANAMYATKSAVDDCTPIVFQATYTDVNNMSRKYTLTDLYAVQTQLVDYFSNNKENPILLIVTSTVDGSKETYIMTHKRSKDNLKEVFFDRTCNPIDGNLQYNQSIHLALHINPEGNFLTTLTNSVASLESYKRILYNPKEAFDMNAWESSGGIWVVVSDSVPGTNIPQGFTSLTGFVLSSQLGCTQVVTDGILKKTMIRSKVFDSISGFVWTPWKQIDGDSENEVIRFTATYDVVDGVNKYTLDAGQDSKYIEYFEQNKANPVELICTPNDSSQPIIKCALDRKRIIGNTYRMNFDSINSSNIEQFELIVTMIVPNDWSHLTLSCRSLPLEASEYKYLNYVPLDSFDMNNWIESGGISVIINADMVGSNIPSDFTEFYGFVLKNKGGKNIKGCCTQVVTDKVLKKTMMRHSFPKSGLAIEWSAWEQIDAVVPEVYVVADYPTDLSSYPDGSIFIKEQI